MGSQTLSQEIAATPPAFSPLSQPPAIERRVGTPVALFRTDSGCAGVRIKLAPAFDQARAETPVSKLERKMQQLDEAQRTIKRTRRELRSELDEAREVKRAKEEEEFKLPRFTPDEQLVVDTARDYIDEHEPKLSVKTLPELFSMVKQCKVYSFTMEKIFNEYVESIERTEDEWRGQCAQPRMEDWEQQESLVAARDSIMGLQSTLCVFVDMLIMQMQIRDPNASVAKLKLEKLELHNDVDANLSQTSLSLG